MLRSEKHKSILELEKIYKDSTSVIVTHYHGLTVSQVISLRRALRAKGASFKVVKNTLSKIATSKIGVNNFASLLFGPTAVVYSKDPIDAAKVVVEFAKANNSLKIIGGLVNKKVLDANSIKHLAKLPSLNESRGKIIGILQAPASHLIRIFQAYEIKIN